MVWKLCWIIKKKKKKKKQRKLIVGLQCPLLLEAFRITYLGSPARAELCVEKGEHLAHM
jgi:hypothetical protein